VGGKGKTPKPDEERGESAELGGGGSFAMEKADWNNNKTGREGRRGTFKYEYLSGERKGMVEYDPHRSMERGSASLSADLARRAMTETVGRKCQEGRVTFPTTRVGKRIVCS